MSNPRDSASDPAIAAGEHVFRDRRLAELRRGSARRPLHGVLAVALVSAAFAVVALGVGEINRRAAAAATGKAPVAVADPGPPPAPFMPVGAAPPAPAPVVRTLKTCVSDAGAMVVTDQICPPGHTLASSREFVPDRRRARPPASTSPGRPARTYPSFATPDPSRASEDARRRCEAAKAYEANYRESRGLKITYDELSNLAEHVRRECADA